MDGPREVSGNAVSETARVLDAIAALLDLSGNPELIGGEAFALLQSTGACSGLALVALKGSVIQVPGSPRGRNVKPRVRKLDA